MDWCPKLIGHRPFNLQMAFFIALEDLFIINWSYFPFMALILELRRVHLHLTFSFTIRIRSWSLNIFQIFKFRMFILVFIDKFCGFIKCIFHCINLNWRNWFKCRLIKGSSISHFHLPLWSSSSKFQTYPMMD